MNTVHLLLEQCSKMCYISNINYGVYYEKIFSIIANDSDVS